MCITYLIRSQILFFKPIKSTQFHGIPFIVTYSFAQIKKKICITINTNKSIKCYFFSRTVRSKFSDAVKGGGQKTE